MGGWRAIYVEQLHEGIMGTCHLPSVWNPERLRIFE
jgi:hypothetical protein